MLNVLVVFLSQVGRQGNVKWSSPVVWDDQLFCSGNQNWLWGLSYGPLKLVFYSPNLYRSLFNTVHALLIVILLPIFGSGLFGQQNLRDNQIKILKNLARVLSYHRNIWYENESQVHMINFDICIDVQVAYNSILSQNMKQFVALTNTECYTLTRTPWAHCIQYMFCARG